MSQFIGVEISGMQGVLNDFKRFDNEVEKAIIKATDDTAKNVISDARKRLKGLLGSSKHWITGTLAKSIKRMKQYEADKYEQVVGTDLEYAPYIEFGTGDMVEIPEGAEGVASQFKGKGIRKVNIKGDSFLNWSAINQRGKFTERVKEQLSKIKK